MAFIIDVSDSMSDDMDKVKQYIDLIMNEQVSKNVSATFIVTTFADPSKLSVTSIEMNHEIIIGLE